MAGHGSFLRAEANSFREDMAAEKLLYCVILLRTHLDIPSYSDENVHLVKTTKHANHTCGNCYRTFYHQLSRTKFFQSRFV